MLELLRFAARCHVSRRDCCTADDSWRLRERRRPGGNTPIGAIGGAGAAVLGIAFGVLALVSHAWGRWRTVALAGLAISILALVVFAIFVLLAG